MAKSSQASSSISVLQSMLNRHKQTTSQFYSPSKDTDQSESKVTVDKLQSNHKQVNCSETTVDPHNLESTVRNASDEDYKLGNNSQESRSSPVVFPKWERRKLASYRLDHLTKAVEEHALTRDCGSECGNMGEQPGLEQEPRGTESGFKSGKDTPVQEEPGTISHGSELLSGPTSGSCVITETAVSEMESSECGINLKSVVQTETQELSITEKSVTKQGLDTSFTCKTFMDPVSRPSLSDSDSVQTNPRSDSSLSVPNSLCVLDMDEAIDNSCSKTQKKIKRKNIAQKLIARLKKGIDQKSSSSSHCEENESQSVTSNEEEQSPVRFQSSPSFSPSENSSNMASITFERTFTLRSFSFNLEPINLLEEVLTGDEWERFLPVKENILQAETDSQSESERSCQPDEVQSHNVVINQEGSESTEQSQSDIEQIKHSDLPVEKVSQLQQRQGKSNSIVFAIPKALITNGAVKQRKSEVPLNEPSNGDDIYDFMEVYMFPKHDIPSKTTGMDPPLDISAVKSLGLLDNSALKSRIHLSKKRKHRPPKKKTKGKSDVIDNSKFYTSCSSTELPPQSSASSASSSTKSATTPTSSSVFYTSFSDQTLPCDSEVSSDCAPADEKQNAKDRLGQIKLWKRKS
ncbi:uncharacterized protein si:dkey-9i23.6 [Hoplias malabaricus]|uniref:uncharacterized protein si:dkey-9i23.6 n=1 Tax=Hoplias malabaricus TaxID=27720 RepID=UPI003461E1B2